MERDKMDWMEFDESKLYESSFFCLQLTIKPSFGAPKFYRITEREIGNLLFVEYKYEKPIDYSIKARILNILGRIDNSIPPKLAIGVDGTGYQLSISNTGFNQVSFSWWESQIGDNWNPLLLVKEELIKLSSDSIP